MLHSNDSDLVLRNRTSNNTITSMFSSATSEEAFNQEFGAKGQIHFAESVVQAVLASLS